MSLPQQTIPSASLSRAAELAADFSRRFGGEPRVFQAPGRVNLIGEHTDYNDGFVMPAAIEFATWVAAGPRSDRLVRLYSREQGQAAEFDLDNAQKGPPAWSEYVRGVALMLERAGYTLGGADLLVHGEVPIGAGLSSSAALEVSSARALAELAGHKVPPLELARICQQAENEFVGARCGIMDQFISSHGRVGHALLLDCRSLEYEPLPLPEEASIVICNTMVKHDLASGEYNLRRSECEGGVELLRERLPGIRALRDVTVQQLEEHRGALPEMIYRRCRHVVGENERVLLAAESLRKGSLERFGNLMAESHASLRDDYEVSCPELDTMVELAAAQRGCLGARMTGGGFGGCTVNLVAAGEVEDFRAAVARGYEQATGRRAEIYVSRPADGLREVTPAA